MNAGIDIFVAGYREFLDQFPEYLPLLNEPEPLKVSSDRTSETLSDAFAKIGEWSREFLNNGELEELKKRLASTLQDKRRRLAETEQNVKRKMQVDAFKPSSIAIGQLQKSLQKIDLNSLRRIGEVLSSLRVKANADNMSADDLDKADLAIRNLFQAMKDAEFLTVLVENEDGLRKCLFPERLPAIDELWLTEDEVTALLEEIREKAPKSKGLAKLPADQPNVPEPVRRNWPKIIRGGGMTVGNIMFGSLVLLGYRPTLGGVDFSPTLWTAATSAYVGVCDVLEGWSPN